MQKEESCKFDFSVFYKCFIDPIEKNMPNESGKGKLVRSVLELDPCLSNAQVSNYTLGKSPIPKKIIDKFINKEADEKKRIFIELINQVNDENARVQLNRQLHDRLMRFSELFDADEIIGTTKYVSRDMSLILSSDDDYIQKITSLLELSIQAQFTTYNNPNTDEGLLKTFFEKMKMPPEKIPYEGLKQKNKITPYVGTYHIYFYSSHYTDTLHTGLIKIYGPNNEGKFEARMIFGINSDTKIHQEEVNKIINVNSNNDAYKLYREYKDSFPYRYDRRFYLYKGRVEISDFYLIINLEGIEEKRKDHRMNIYLNISRANKYSNIYMDGYKGGLALVVSMPNKSIQKIRSFKMGVSSRPLNIKCEKLMQMLKLSITANQRIQVQRDDDTEFFDYLLECEAKS